MSRNSEKIRLNKFIALCLGYSRRKADEIIFSNKVFVNGNIINSPAYYIENKNDKVLIDKTELNLPIYKYIKFYKPSGYITSRLDEKNRKTIYNILPKEFSGLKPVGRLDKKSSGLLILTNDGDLIYNLTHPKVQIEKVYKVSCVGRLSNNNVEKMKKGFEIEKNKVAYANVEIISYENKITTCVVTLYQGLNRQIRKMFQMVGNEVISLKRIRHANITIEGLKRGEYKYIHQRQIRDLKKRLKNNV